MPSIATLVESGAILKIEVELGPREQPMRLLYGTPQFIQWLEGLLEGAEPEVRLGEATAAEQVDDLFYTYLSGKPLSHVRQFRVVRAEKNAVWELKTPDVRIFGWFMARDCFVGVFGDWTDRVKDHDLYRGYRIAIRRLRRELGVEGTLCVAGIEPSDVLSF
ncbi:MAG TPA: hypothetical protein VFS63_08345 [Pseudolabrys sp.]|jgi:hypothetical protein|nr:hypothetical protein [Pseudolabrys sp.]